ncbi:FAD-dependent oxidoreductase [Pseudonocardia spinosispora]|uniref:oxidoreductase n=1 Tax=Pseudonocardia spinosispora TaxID=103441 RepID=UPI0004247A27|nr:FAD-dependent oxidoreductase [Pseudonocardia spinosispora]
MKRFEPLRLRGVTLRNRIVFAAHLTNFAADGLPTDRHAAYYGARAAGGAALVITEEHSVHPDDRPYEKLIRGHDPAVLPGYRLITDAVHEHGAVVLAQLNHNGGQSTGRYSRRPVWAPSAVPDAMFREVPVAISAAQIAELVQAYRNVAARCVDGGFDGVEVQCSHASIVRQFLSPTLNLRTDEYGGSLVNRTRLLRRLVAVLRDTIGPDRVLGVRLGCDELDQLDELAEIARMLGTTGHVDYLNSSVGVAGTTQHRITPPMGERAGYALPVSAALRAAGGMPVVGIGRFTTPGQAERALADGRCDLVGVVRGQISDPDFVASGGRTCLGCNQECVGRVGRNHDLACVQNPHAGREWLAGPVAGSARVLVVGGGPAGLRAAATAAARGHRVTLCEAATDLGGQVRLAASAPSRAELGLVVSNLEAECRVEGVEVRLDTAVDEAFVADFAPDALVLATGSRAAPPSWVVTGVCDVRDVLTGAVRPSGDVLVYDELGCHQASSVAELLAARGCTVEIRTPAMVVAQELGTTLDRERFRRTAGKLGIGTHTDQVVLDAHARDGRVTVQLLHHPTGVHEQRSYEAVVCALPAEPHNLVSVEHGCSHTQHSRGVYRVGDCVAPRQLAQAILDGHRVGEQL